MLDEDGLQRFSAKFAEEILPAMSFAQKEDKESLCHATVNILVDGNHWGLGNSEASWHSDMTYLQCRRLQASCLLKFRRREAIPIFSTNMRPTMRCLLTSRPGSTEHQARCSIQVMALTPGVRTFDDPRDALVLSINRSDAR